MLSSILKPRLKIFVVAGLLFVAGPSFGAVCAELFQTPGLPRMSVEPVAIATHLAANLPDIYRQDLSVKNSPLTKTDSRALVSRDVNQAAYRFFIGNDPAKRIEIAPHAILLMGEVIAATRLETKIDKRRITETSPIQKLPLFRDVIARLRFLTGRLSATTEEVQELTRVTDLLKEGQRGISDQEAAAWFRAVVSEAAKKRELTWSVVQDTFYTRLKNGKFRTRSPVERDRWDWEALGTTITLELTAPRWKSDLAKAIEVTVRSKNERTGTNEPTGDVALRDVLNQFGRSMRHPGQGGTVPFDLGNALRSQGYSDVAIQEMLLVLLSLQMPIPV